MAPTHNGIQFANQGLERAIGTQNIPRFIQEIVVIGFFAGASAGFNAFCTGRSGTLAAGCGLEL